MEEKFDWKEYFIRLCWRIALIPSILLLVPVIPSVMILGTLVWFFTGRNTENYGRYFLDWYHKKIWIKIFP